MKNSGIIQETSENGRQRGLKSTCKDTIYSN
jgi:hypothetical protein